MSKSIIAVVGDYYHPEHLIKESLNAAFQPLADESGFSLAYISADQLSAALDARPDAVILYKEDRLNPQDADIRRWMTTDVARSIVSYVEDGGGWLAWHSGMASYPEDGAYIAMLKGGFKWHPNEHRTVRYELAADHSIIRGTDEEAFEAIDEQYFVQCDTAKTEVLLRSYSADGESIAGWAHPFGKGRVCCLTPAHRSEGLLHPAFVRLLRETIRWLSRSE